MAVVIAVSVTYNPPREVLEGQAKALQGQVHAHVVVDNGSSAAFRKWLLEEASRLGVAVLSLDKNVGIAAAQNIGIREAQRQGGTHVLLLDHDSIPRPDMVRELVEALTRATASGAKVAAVGPRWIDANTGRSAPFVRVGPLSFRRVFCEDAQSGPVKVDLLVSSGMLFSVQAFESIGPMREELFVDHIDTDWCLRARALGWALYGVGSAVLEHSLGERTMRLWLGRWRVLHVHSPERHYYYVRNAIIVTRSSWAPLKWGAAEIPRMTLMSAAYATLVAPRLSYIGMTAKAVLDGLRGRVGPVGRSAAGR